MMPWSSEEGGEGWRRDGRKGKEKGEEGRLGKGGREDRIWGKEGRERKEGIRERRRLGE